MSDPFIAAVQRCCDAYYTTLAIPRPRDGRGDSETFARQAYREAMPFLAPAHIDAFIACVTHGMLLGVLFREDASRLLYAAQVAIASQKLQQSIRKTTPTPSPSTSKAPSPTSSTSPASVASVASPAGPASSAAPKTTPTPSPAQATTTPSEATPATPKPPQPAPHARPQHWKPSHWRPI